MSRSFLTPILLPADPTTALQAATKQYVDATVSTGSGQVNSFMFSSTTSEPPTGSQLRFNNATYASVTLLWVMQTTTDGLDVSTGLTRLNAGSGIYIQDFDESNLWVQFDVTAAATDKGVYWEIPVSFNSASASPLNVQKIAVQTLVPASHGLPTGGADGDVLTKTSGSNYAVAWETPAAAGGSASGTKLSALTALTGASTATGDLLEVVDVSDTTMAASGTNKKITVAELVIALGALGIVVDGDLAAYTPTSRTITATAPITIAGTTSADLSANRTLAIATDGVTNTLLAQMATNTLKGNNTGSTAGPTDLTVTQVKTMLAIDNITVSSTAPGSPATNDLWVDTT